MPGAVKAPAPRPRLWRLVLGYGLGLWLVTLGAMAFTQNTTLAPSVIFVGSFLTPITLTVWLVERQQYTGAAPDGTPSELTAVLLVGSFVGTGVLGVAVSSVLESLVPPAPQARFFLAAAVIEEAVKLGAVWWLARGFHTYHRRDGMVLGACVGFGFAAFETAGYAFNVLIQQPDATADSLLPIIGTQVVRAVLTPVGHGLWTALVAGALFAAARHGRLRISSSVLGWWMVVVALHFLWDEVDAIAAALTGGETGRVTDAVRALLFGLCALVGAWLARREWIKGRARVPGFPHAPDVGQRQPPHP